MIRLSHTLSLTPQGDHEIVMSRQFRAPAALVYDAYTKPDLMKRWFGGPPGWSLTLCEIDLRIGGTYHFGMSGPDGAVMGMGGVYKDLDRPLLMVNTERFDPPFGETEQLITSVLSEKDGLTTFTATIWYETKQARDGMLGSMGAGIGHGYDRLEDLLGELQGEGAQ